MIVPETCLVPFCATHAQTFSASEESRSASWSLSWLLIGCGKKLKIMRNFWPYYAETCVDYAET